MTGCGKDNTKILFFNYFKKWLYKTTICLYLIILLLILLVFYRKKCIKIKVHNYTILINAH